MICAMYFSKPLEYICKLKREREKKKIYMLMYLCDGDG